MRDILVVCFYIHIAIECGKSMVPLNSTSVRVSWTPVNLTVVNHYTVHYTTVGGVNDTILFPATSSSGVVTGLQGGQVYWFSVTMSMANCTLDHLITDCHQYHVSIQHCMQANMPAHHMIQFVFLLCGLYFMDNNY